MTDETRTEIEQRLREIEDYHAFAATRGAWSDWRVGHLVVVQVPWLVAQLRAALAAVPAPTEEPQ